jgi:uncharacterized protein YjbI with pentapeptide repeats
MQCIFSNYTRKKEIRLVRAKLREIDLSNANLSEADLTRANFRQNVDASVIRQIN